MPNGRPRGLFLAAVMVAVLTGQSCQRGARAPSGEAEPSAPAGAVFIGQPLTFCWQKPMRTKPATAQVLIDGSGSMNGFQQPMRPLVEWLNHGVSQLRGSTVEVQKFRLCQFRQGQGIADCSELNQTPRPLRAAGNTNLHEAIRSARDYDLTYVLTDGVAATGGRGSGDCASGVDAACVARSIRDVMHAGGGGSEWGVWLVPLLATFDGTHYTEEQISPEDFDPAETIKLIQSDTNVEPVIQGAQAGADGRLTFRYRGPRSLILLVFARDAFVGRSAVQALWERAEYSGVRRVEQMQGYTPDLAVLPPVEVYPGFLNPVEWSSLHESDDPSQMRGTMDAALERGPGGATISVSCPKDGSGEGAYRLGGSSPAESRTSGCVPLRLLPAVELKLRPADGGDDAQLGGFISEYRWDAGNYRDLNLRLACGSQTGSQCDRDPLRAQWTAYMNYEMAADALADAAQGFPTHRYLISLSTNTPSREPHRIFALSATLESFFREVSRDQRSVTLGNIGVCQRR